MNNIPERIMIFFPRRSAARVIKRMFSNKGAAMWAYLGEDYFRKKFLEKALGIGFCCINISRRLDDAANDIRLGHVRWIDELNRLNGKTLEWWFGGISSRNVKGSRLFQYSCYMELIKDFMSSPRPAFPEFLVVESPALAMMIKKWALAKGVQVEIEGCFKERFIGRLIGVANIVRQWVKFIFACSSRWLWARITLRIYGPKDMKNVDHRLIIETYVHDHSLSDTGVFRDLYYPMLHEFLFKKGLRAVVFPILYGFERGYRSIYKRMRMSATHFILQEDFLKISDYIYAMSYPLRALARGVLLTPFRDIDFFELVEEEKLREPLMAAFQSILTYRLFLRLGETALSPKEVISWYENQGINKALIAGAREAFPDARIVGAQMFIHSPNFLSLFPSQSEAEAALVPHVLLEMSERQCEVAQSFTKLIPCRPAASLRYSSVFSWDVTANVSEARRARTSTILVLLTFDLRESAELLDMIKEGAAGIPSTVRILIKCHPDYSLSTLIRYLGEKDFPRQFEFLTSVSPGVLNSVSAAVSFASSSMVETVARGIPAVFLAKRTSISQDPFSGLDMDIITKCFSVSELVSAINKYLNLSDDERGKFEEMGRQVRDLFFTRITEETMQPFLDAVDVI